MTMPAAQPRMSVLDYFDFAEAAVEKWEFHDGEVLAMSGGTYEHSLINTNLLAAVHGRLRGSRCRALESNMRVRATIRDYVYPDASVLCGSPRFDPADTERRTIFNPSVIVEVVSPSTEKYDRGRKFELYRRIESLQHYVLVSQRLPRIEVFSRAQGQDWPGVTHDGLDAVATLEAVKIGLPLAEVYQDVDLDR